jgi:hypothetical protein
MEKDFFGKAELEYFSNPCPVLALDEYKKDRGEDEFSRKQVWFHVYGDDEIEEEFYHGLKDLIETRFQNDKINWDLMTLYPTHVKGKVNPHMDILLKRISKNTGIAYRNVIHRTQTTEENHELESTKAKVVNLQGTATCEDVEGKNVILVDNITLSGTSLLHGANLLIENGAENVFGVCLGMGESFPGKNHISRGKKASELL